MRVRAPGKLLLSGAYAVLEGAPALVLAVDRYAVADCMQFDSAPAPEVAAAIVPSPRVDVSAMREGDEKLGLGSSAAAVVAALGTSCALRGEALGDRDVRARLAHAAWSAHAQVQSGGSGVDVAASVYGGALSFSMGQLPASVSLPVTVRWTAFFSGAGARTSSLRATVNALRLRSADAFGACINALGDASHDATLAISAGDVQGLIAALQRTRRGLEQLGRASGAPIVSGQVSALADLAEAEGSAFFPSGAGGGDCCLFVGTTEPSEAFVDHASRASQRRIALSLDTVGVCLAA